MRQDPSILKAIEKILRKEILLYQEYLELVIEEEKWVSKFNVQRIQDLTAKRAGLCAEMLAAQDARLEIMRQFPEYQGLKLHNLVMKYFTPRDAKPVLALIKELREIIQATQSRSRQHNRIVGFGLKVVHGISSIFWSAKQTVVTSYGRSGKVKQSYQPKDNNRLAGVLSRA